MQVGSQERLQPSVKHGGETVIFRGLKISTEKVPSI